MTSLWICVGAVMAGTPLSVAAAPAPDPATPSDPQSPEDVSAASTPEELGEEQEVEQEVEQLLRDGGGAYQLGDFDLAIEKFEAAYRLSPQPRLLYNLAVAYFRRYDGSSAEADLHRAQALLTNFAIELQRDPSLGDSENVERLIAQVDEKIAEHEQRQAALREQASMEQSEALEAEPECPLVPEIEAPDNTRGRTIGATLMGAGSVSFAAGIASIAGFSLRGAEFKNRLVVLQAEHGALGCSESSASASCADYEDAIAATTTNGRRANILAATVGGTLTALGAAGLVAGVVVFSNSDKRARGGDRRASLSVAPSVSGVVLSGRF